MTLISSVDFGNCYEKFYAAMRQYLWPYSTLEALADVEVDIYTTFIDMDKLSRDLEKLRGLIKEDFDDDPKLKKTFDELADMVHIVDPSQYARLAKVIEINPEKIKTLVTDSEQEEEEI